MTEDDALALVRNALATAVPHRAMDLQNAAQKASLHDLELDSIATLEVIGLVEDALGGIEIPDEQLGTIRSVQHLINIVMEHQS
jgi:acyl carrier protein